MEPYTYKLKRILRNTSKSIKASRLQQARQILVKFSERLELWVSSAFKTQVLVDPHLDVQDASSGSGQSTRLASKDPLITRRDSITCQSTINSTNNLDTNLVTEPPPNPGCHFQNDGDKHRDGELPEEGPLDDRRLEPLHNDLAALQHQLSNASEEPELFKDSAAVLSRPSDTLPPLLTIQYQSAETVESFDCLNKVRTEDPNLIVDMLCKVSPVVIDASKAENNDQVIQDAGLCIIITPPDDTSAAHNNRIGLQYLTRLVVPPFYKLTSRLIKYEEWMALYYPTVGIVSQDQPAVRTSAGPLVFSPTAFQKHLQDTKNDSFNCFYIVTALQRHQLKAAAFTASLKACLFRMRYDTPGFLENIEPQFQWIDPAEILIESLRQTPESVTIYTSYRPCSVPHIVIHESPPNDPYVAWNNSTDAQNYCFLTLFSPNPSLWGRDACQTADDCFTDDSSSLYDSSLPATPKDFASTFAQDLDTLFEEDTYEIQHCNDIHQQYGDEYLVPQYSVTPQSNDTTFSSKAKFFIPDDEEEDSLPPLDDWYISIANRCMPPEEAEAVAAAAAVTVSCA